MGRHFPRPNESLTLEKSTNRRPAGNPPLTPLLHTHGVVFKTPVNSAENTCSAYIREEKMTTTKCFKMMSIIADPPVGKNKSTIPSFFQWKNILFVYMINGRETLR